MMKTCGRRVGRNNLIAICTTALTLLTPAVLFGVEGSSDEQPLRYHREVGWVITSQGLEARALFFFQSSEKGLVARLLVESPAARRAVLTKILISGSGRDRVRLADERTGWWLEVEKTYGVSAPGLGEFFRKLEAWLKPAAGNTIEHTLRTSDGLELTSKIPVAEQPQIEHQALVAALRDAGFADALRGRIPEGFEEMVLFLDGALDTVAADARAPVDLLAALAADGSGELRYAGMTWTETEGPLQKGLTLLDPEARRFADEFPSVGGVEPLPLGELDFWASQDTSP